LNIENIGDDEMPSDQKEELEQLERKLIKEKESHSLTTSICAFVIWLGILILATKDPTSWVVLIGGFAGAYFCFSILPKLLNKNEDS
jgi:cyanate permease